MERGKQRERDREIDRHRQREGEREKQIECETERRDRHREKRDREIEAHCFVKKGSIGRVEDRSSSPGRALTALYSSDFVKIHTNF